MSFQQLYCPDTHPCLGTGLDHVITVRDVLVTSGLALGTIAFVVVALIGTVALLAAIFYWGPYLFRDRSYDYVLPRTRFAVPMPPVRPTAGSRWPKSDYVAPDHDPA